MKSRTVLKGELQPDGLEEHFIPGDVIIGKPGSIVLDVEEFPNGVLEVKYIRLDDNGFELSLIKSVRLLKKA